MTEPRDLDIPEFLRRQVDRRPAREPVIQIQPERPAGVIEWREETPPHYTDEEVTAVFRGDLTG